jgi:hypothetical protein
MLNRIRSFTSLNLPWLEQKTEVYPSFWPQSPRSHQDLLLEPNLPQVDLYLSQSGAVSVWLNDRKILDRRGADTMAIASVLGLRAGWNHFLIKLTRSHDRWAFAANFAGSQPDFISQNDSSLEMP